MSKRILVLGKSSIAEKLQKNCNQHSITILGKPEYNFASKSVCDKIIDLCDHDVIILSYAINKTDDFFDMINTNITSTSYMITKLYQKIKQGQIIFVSSAIVNWVSFPDIDNQRMIYGWTKECVSKLCEHINRQNSNNSKNIAVQVYEPNSFTSKMNPQSTIDINFVAKELEHLIDHPRISVLRGLNKNV